MALRKKQLVDLGATEANAAKYLAALNQQFHSNAIDTSLRSAHFLAQVYHESMRLKVSQENLNYSADRLRKIFRKYYKTAKDAAAHARKPKLIASRVYANRMGNGDEASGDGWRYRGRGLIQLTGKNNYKAFSDVVGDDCVANPDRVKDLYAVHSATFYWMSRNINALADADDVKAVTKAINGGLNGLDDRVELLERAKELLGSGSHAPPPTLHRVTHRVKASALNLRSRPVVSANTLIATMPEGTELQALPGAVASGWLRVRAILDRRVQEGCVSAEHLTKVPSAPPPEPLPVVPELADADRPTAIPVAHLRENNREVKRTNDKRAFPLGEPGRPGRSGRTPAARALQLIEILRYLDVEKTTHLRWKPGGSTTYCNIYAYDYCYLAGVYLPRVWWTDPALQQIRSGATPRVRYAATVRELNANALFDWLSDYGPVFGWQRELDPAVLQSAANNGEVCVIVAKRHDGNRPGHIAAAVPEHAGAEAFRNASGDVLRPLQSQAGRNNHRFSSGSSRWWTGAQFEFSGFWRHA